MHKPKLNILPPHLNYIFLEEGSREPIIIRKSLSTSQEKSLIQVLKGNKEVIWWVLADLKGISPCYWMHKIVMEETFKPIAHPQCLLIPTTKEVVKKEMVKFLEAGMIYPILDNTWMSLVHVVPKTTGMTVIWNIKKWIHSN